MATPATTQTTAVSAVNAMLESIGERPVNDIDNTQRLDVQTAVRCLNETNVLWQTRGWWFNREEEVTLSPNGDGEYDIPSNVVKIDPTYDSDWEWVKRGNKLWNRDTQAFTGHTADLYVNYILLLDFDDCPESFKQYVARRAGVLFQSRKVGSPTLFEFTSEFANEAWAILQQEEVDNEDSNLTYAREIAEITYSR